MKKLFFSGLLVIILVFGFICCDSGGTTNGIVDGKITLSGKLNIIDYTNISGDSSPGSSGPLLQVIRTVVVEVQKRTGTGPSDWENLGHTILKNININTNVNWSVKITPLVKAVPLEKNERNTGVLRIAVSGFDSDEAWDRPNRLFWVCSQWDDAHMTVSDISGYIGNASLGNIGIVIPSQYKVNQDENILVITNISQEQLNAGEKYGAIMVFPAETPQINVESDIKRYFGFEQGSIRYVIAGIDSDGYSLSYSAPYTLTAYLTRAVYGFEALWTATGSYDVWFLGVRSDDTITLYKSNSAISFSGNTVTKNAQSDFTIMPLLE